MLKIFIAFILMLYSITQLQASEPAGYVQLSEQDNGQAGDDSDPVITKIQRIQCDRFYRWNHRQHIDFIKDISQCDITLLKKAGPRAFQKTRCNHVTDHQLLSCGHIICMDCLRDDVAKGNLPLCSTESCQQPLAFEVYCHKLINGPCDMTIEEYQAFHPGNVSYSEIVGGVSNKAEPQLVSLACGHVVYKDCLRLQVEALENDNLLRCPICQDPQGPKTVAFLYFDSEVYDGTALDRVDSYRTKVINHIKKQLPSEYFKVCSYPGCQFERLGTTKLNCPDH